MTARLVLAKMNALYLKEHQFTRAVRPRRTKFRKGTIVSSLALAWLASGCASPSGDSSAPKPGSGIAEYRVVTHDAHQAVAETVRSLEALAQPPGQTTSAHPALPGFDRAFHQLELTSIKTRARAEAIIARGQGYFDEWREHLASMTNQTTAQAESQQYARLFEHFQGVRQRSGEVRDEFRPFMRTLREFRARLDQPAGSASGGLAKNELDGLITGGRRVMDKLDAVSSTLDDAEAELQATMLAQRKK